MYGLFLYDRLSDDVTWTAQIASRPQVFFSSNKGHKYGSSITWIGHLPPKTNRLDGRVATLVSCLCLADVSALPLASLVYYG